MLNLENNTNIWGAHAGLLLMESDLTRFFLIAQNRNWFSPCNLFLKYRTAL